MFTQNATLEEHTMLPVVRPTAVSFLLVLLAACGSGPDGSKAKQASSSPVVPASPDSDLVAALKDPTGNAPVSARFELLERPVVGADFGLRVRIEVAEALETLQVRFEVPESLQPVGAEPAIRESRVPAGATMDRSFKLRATRDGFYELRVTAEAEAPRVPRTSAVFSIPLVVDRSASLP